MKVEKGYKQTEVGVIPADWDLVSYGKSFDFLNTATYSRSQLSETGEVQYVHYGDIHTRWNHFLDFGENDLPKISNDKVKNYSLIRNGDVIMADASEDLGGIGTSIEVKNIEGKKVISGLHTFLLRDKGFFIDGFRGYIHLNQIVRTQFLKLATGMKVFGVSKTNLKNILIPIPPTKKEQIIIANALKETDALITNLGNLIAKKQNIKQATMQVLLTGRKRLKGFTNEWRKISLNKIGDTYGGLSGKTKKDFENGKFAYITFLNVMNNPVIDINAFDMVNLSVGENQNKVQKGDLLFNGSSETPEEVGMCSAMLKEFPDLYLNSFCFGFRLKKELKNDPLYLSYYFRSKQGRKHFYSLAQGATRYNLSKSNFLQLEILLPEPNEQKALAELFWDMTKEIEALQQQYSKYKLMKQGMLQNLLTGKVRLTNT